ncbi:hypothetical protein GUJ93_ZPchr0004g39116 [Zizania palustris]|uniref:Uncharacterized protein n=1 Tax=Zizania palustris TaxID=103762 RepID=A0A8J5T0W1_ZIZPA|nr:hypothetical protein GUJ93_ZPchr0004g39116 [Zizania palustris]
MANTLFSLHGEAELGDGGASSFAADMVEEASHDTMKLRRVLVAGGVGMFYTYYGVLSGIIVFGVAEAWTGLWVSYNCRRRAVGMTMLWLSVLPLFFLAGVAGSAILKGQQV